MSYAVAKVLSENFHFVHSQTFARSPDHLYQGKTTIDTKCKDNFDRKRR